MLNNILIALFVVVLALLAGCSKSVLKSAKTSSVTNALSAAKMIAKHFTSTQVFILCDMTVPSNQPRMYIYDKDFRLLYKTYVAHGRNSGNISAPAVKFSNIPGSNETSIGVYKAGSTYEGKHGLSMYLYGLEPGFNDRIFSRTIVLHGATYVQTGGRSNGCLAVPQEVSQHVIDITENKAIIIVYGNDSSWLKTSRYLT